MALGRPLGDDETCRDLFIAEPLCQERCHLVLAFGEHIGLCRDRWDIRAKPRSPRQRSERSSALRVRVLRSSSRPPAGFFTGT